MNVVRTIPPDKVDWGFREGKFTLGDLVRHIATANRYLFIEICQGKPAHITDAAKTSPRPMTKSCN